MKHRITLALFLLCALTSQFTLAQPAADNLTQLQKQTDSLSAVVDSLRQELGGMSTMDARAEQTVQHSQNSVDLAVGHIGTAVTLLTILIGAISLLLIIAGLLGWWDRRRNEILRKQLENLETSLEKQKEEMETLKADMESTVADAKDAARFIKIRRGEIEQDITSRREKIEFPSLTETPSDELKEQLDQLTSRLDDLERFGGSLSAKDYYSRGVDLYFKNSYDEALNALDKAIELEPDNPSAWYLKGIIFIDLKQYDEALFYFNKTIEVKPETTWPLFQKSRVYALLGQKDNSLASLKQAIELSQAIKYPAKEDEAFKSLRDDPEFKKLVE